MKKYLLLIWIFSSNIWAQNVGVVIVDMQYGFYVRERALQTNELIQLVSKQQELLAWAKKKKIPVLFFEYYGYQETDSALTNTLWGHKFKIITKRDDNGFNGRSGDEANIYLQLKEVDTIIMAGINASGCVKSTAIGAIVQGYNVISSSDIVADFYQRPPRYPQLDWFIDDFRFQGYETLDELIKRFE